MWWKHAAGNTSFDLSHQSRVPRGGLCVCFNVRLTTAVPRYGYSYARHCHLCTLRTWVREGRPGGGWGCGQGVTTQMWISRLAPLLTEVADPNFIYFIIASPGGGLQLSWLADALWIPLRSLSTGRPSPPLTLNPAENKPLVINLKSVYFAPLC